MEDYDSSQNIEKSFEMKITKLYIRKICIQFVIVITAALLFVLCPAAGNVENVSAADNMAYELVSYNVLANVYQNHSYKVQETIKVNIPERLDKLEFALPSGNFQVTDIKVQNVKNTVQKTEGRRSLTITDPKALKKGNHTYRVNFTIKEFAERNDEYDMFYYDALLPEWRVPIGNVEIKVFFPDDFPWDDMQYYGGQFGIAGESAKLNYKASEADKTVIITGERIPENYSVTLKAQLPDDYWKGALDNTWAGYAIAGILLAVVIISFVLWLIGGRDPKYKKSVERKPIEGVAPSDITYIYEGKVKIRDIVALILYMATKGYIRISEYEPKKYRFFRNEDPKNEERYIRSAYNTLFEGIYENRSIDMDDLGTRLRQVVHNARYDIEAGYADEAMAASTSLSRYFRLICILLISLAVGSIPVLTAVYQYIDISLTQPIIFAVLTAASLMLICAREVTKYDIDNQHYYISMGIYVLIYAAVVGSPIYIFVEVSGMILVGLAAFALAVLAMFFCVIMTARGKGNAELVMKLNQLRKFIYRAKWTDVEPLYKEDPDYYYEMFPYAFVFSGLETWAKTFRWLNVPEPKWYSDDIEGHADRNLNRKLSSIDYARFIKAFTRTMEDSYNAMIRHNRRGQGRKR